jgi:hypothetical protein
MQIESTKWKRHDGRRGCSVSARCASNLRGAMECTLIPLSSLRERNELQERKMQVLEGTKKSEESILE